MRRDELDVLIVQCVRNQGEWTSAYTLHRLVLGCLNLHALDELDVPTLQLVARRASALAQQGHLQRVSYEGAWQYRMRGDD